MEEIQKAKKDEWKTKKVANDKINIMQSILNVLDDCLVELKKLNEIK